MKKVLLILFAFILSFGLQAQENLKGYSIGHLWAPFPNEKINTEGMKLFDELAPDILRFPGGSIANKYHFYKTGYGWSKGDERKEENYIVAFVKLVKELKKEPKVVYVYNIFDHFKGANEADLIKENFDALQYLLDHDINVVAVELGNEFYLYNEVIGLPGFTFNPEDNNLEEIETGDVDAEGNPKPAPKKENFLMRWLRILTGKKNFVDSKTITSNKSSTKAVTANSRLEKYARLAKLYHDKTKAIDPAIRTGVPLGNFKNKKHTEYNQYILSSTFDFTDAFVLHFYGAFNNKCKEGDLVCLKAGLDWSLRSSIEPRLKYVKENKSDKEIWVTEWNSIKFGHHGDEAEWARNTSVHIEYVKVFIDLFDKYDVRINTFHKLAGFTEGASYNAIDVAKDGRVITTPVFDVLKKYF